MARYFTFILGFFITQLYGQSVSELIKSAARLEAEGHLYDAAQLQEKAWRIKPQDKIYAWQAGQNYYYAKDYRKAVDCLGPVKLMDKEYPLSGLMYARALKHDGRYREAMEAFTQFLKQYNGPEKKQLEEVVVIDMQGCDYALQQKGQTANKPELKFEILPEAVNSLENEFAPIPVTDDLLYFTSNFQGSIRIYRTGRQDGVWSRPEPASGLPTSAGQHFGNGCFSPDGSRFYFTQCAAPSRKQKDGKQSCGIYMTRNTGNGQWTEPERLRDYINTPNATNTQPTVFELNGEEVMVFVSDREGGLGGSDLYRCSRPLASGDIDFSLPVNLGPKINTPGDELTPFVNIADGRLYFSSNGHLNMGGFDIFQCDFLSDQPVVKNLGLPYNSSADDTGFTLKKSGLGGYLVSNRFFLPQKSSTRHEDIFEFSKVEKRYYLTAVVFDDEQRISMRNLDVALYERGKDGKLSLLTQQKFAEGDIQFEIEPNRQYAIEVSKQGYQTQLAETSSLTASGGNHKLSVNLRKKDNEKSQAFTKSTTTQPATTQPAPQRFFVQLETVAKPNLEAVRYDEVRKLGQLITLKGDGNYSRVALGPFGTREAANEVARAARDIPDFGAAMVVRF